jgi:DNA invertase Pin-like site-specific DNA recombinase
VTPAEDARRVQAAVARELAAAHWQPGAQPAGIYLRVSTQGQTVENQLAAVVAMAAARGYVVGISHVYLEKQSGADLDRPELTRALEAAARGRIRAIFAWAIDRLSRDDSFSGGVREIGEFDRVGCAVLSHEETWIDSSGPFRPVFVQLALRLAADERQRKNRRSKEAVALRVQQCRDGVGFWRKDRKDGRPPKFVQRWGRPSKYGDEVKARALALNEQFPLYTVPQIARTLASEFGLEGSAGLRESVRGWLNALGRTYAAGPRFGASA